MIKVFVGDFVYCEGLIYRSRGCSRGGGWCYICVFSNSVGLFGLFGLCVVNMVVF